ncbi:MULTISPECIES: hypothetical protein [Streptomyces]|uniref:hypothetical protein n=1 Tax=Streptomyces TaxID=1883 RepID=UPI00287F5A1F|nr:hypothetical protein [Streptomyces sp. CGMCC 4.1456]WNF61257.1 hypothetical protein RJD14_01195 [Streptomyces sp. CGMCC 4.1456]
MTDARRPSSAREAAPTGSAAEGRGSSRGRFGTGGTSAEEVPGPGTAARGGGTAGPASPGSGGGSKSGGASNGHPRFPSLGATAPERTESTAPPPPLASARFPDTPPGVRPETRSESNRPSTPPDTPPRPRHLPGSSGRPGPLPTPRRTGAPAENAAETTRRLRPIPADPSPAERSERPDSETAETSGRPGSVRPGTPPRPTREPQAGAGLPAGADTGSGAGPGMRMPPAPTQRPLSATPAPPPPASAPASRVSPDPAFSWSAPLTPGGTSTGARPVVSFGEPEGYDGDARPRPLGRRGASQAAAAAACLVLGLGLISGAVTGSWLVGDSGEEGSRSTFATAGSLWHSVPVDQLFPPTVQGQGAGPGGADRTWTRIAVAPDSGCKDAFDPLLRKALAPVGCERLLRATYTDATQSYVTTVGLLFTTADAPGMTSLANRFRKERLDRRSDLMPLPYAARNTPAARFGTGQRASWTVSVLTEAPVVVYAVSGWADGRTVDDPQPAEDAMEPNATTAPAQAGLGNEAQGLADRVERGLRKNVRSATEQPS